jgi:hypothetical protein
VDEETTATALGLVAMCVQRLGEMIGEDLLYPVTCLGSRSLVRDNISVITGPRRCVETRLIFAQNARVDPSMS